MVEDGADLEIEFDIEETLDYSNSSPFDPNLKLHGPGVNAVIEAIAAQLLESGAVRRWEQSHSDHLNLILGNLYNAYRKDKFMYVAYPRMKNIYFSDKRYSSIALSYSRMLDIVDGLGPDKLNYLQLKKGCYYEKSKFRSRMRASHELISLIKLYADPRKVMIIRNSVAEPIILKDKGNKKKIDYTDTEDTIRMRENVRRINALLKQHFIGLCVLDDVLSEMLLASIRVDRRRRYEGDPEILWGYRHFSWDNLYRVFNNGTFENGGRFYGGGWQEIPSSFRKFIRIDNVMTSEVDFSEFHPRLLYLEKGAAPPSGDIYELEVIPRGARKLVKKLTNIMLNVGNSAGALIAIANERKRDKTIPEPPDGVTDKQIINAILEKHEPIRNFFFTRFGHKLMRIDSDIAESIMLRLADKDIVALPVHDSFIVARHHVEDLVEAMKHAVFTKYGRHMPYKLDPTAWDSIREIGIEEEFGTIERFESSLAGCDEYVRRLREWEEAKTQK